MEMLNVLCGVGALYVAFRAWSGGLIAWLDHGCRSWRLRVRYMRYELSLVCLLHGFVQAGELYKQ